MKPHQYKLCKATFLVLLLLVVFSAGSAALASPAEQQARFVAPKLVVNVSFLNIRTGPGAQYTVLLTVVGGTELPVLGVFADKVWYQVSTVVGVGWANSMLTLPRGDFSAVPLVEAPAVTGGLVVQDMASLAALGQGGGEVVPAAAVGGAASGGGLPWGISVLGGDLHASPSDASIKLNQAMSEDRSTIYPLLGFATAEGTNWYQIAMPDIAPGWLQEQFVLVRPLVCPGANMSAAIITRPTGLQSGPNAPNAPTFGLNAGTEVFVRDVRDGRVRVELFTRDTGWVLLEATMGRDETKLHSMCSSTAVPGVPGAATGATFGPVPVVGTGASLVAPRVVINTGFLNARSGPGGQFTVVATLPGGSEVPVVGITRDSSWFLVQGPFGQGWVDSQFTLFRGDISVVPVVRTSTGVLSAPMASIAGVITLYSTPNSALGTIGAVSGPAQVPVVARNADFSWVQLNTSIGFGWVPTSQVSIFGDTSTVPVVQ